MLDIKVMIKDIDLKLEELIAKMNNSFEQLKTSDIKGLIKMHSQEKKHMT